MAMTDTERPSAIILIVEDEPLQRLSLIDLVEDGGFEALEATDAASAVTILEARNDVRLVLTDIDMPGAMDGMQLAAMVRNRWPPIEIVILSAGTPPDLSELPARAVFFSKPIDKDRLLEELRRMACS